MRFLLVLLFLPFFLFAQADTDDDGFFFSSGPVYNDEQLTGYFTLQIGKVDEETLKYTIKLLDRNADQIGKTVYTSDMENMLQLNRIVYNGSHLGLILSGGDVAEGMYLDVLDARGERVLREELPGEFGQYVQALHPVPGGFILNSGYDETDRRNTADNRWVVRFIPSREGAEGWTRKTNRIDDNATEFIYLLDETEDLLLFGLNHGEKRGTKNDYRALVGMNPSTGEELFRYKTPVRESYSTYESADIREDGFTILKDYQPGKYTVAGMPLILEIERWSLEGELLSSKMVNVEQKMEARADNKYSKEYRYTSWSEMGRMFNADGTITFGMESFRLLGNKVKFNEAFTVVIDQEGDIRTMVRADRPPYVLAAKMLGAPTGLPVMSRKGRDMMADIQNHGGPVSWAGQQRTEDLSIQYFFNREFTKEGVKYTSVCANYYLDGELHQEIIPFESDADMVRIYPGKEGYFLVMEAYGNGTIKTRLERLDL